jgi:hypothetical protein
MWYCSSADTYLFYRGTWYLHPHSRNSTTPPTYQTTPHHIPKECNSNIHHAKLKMLWTNHSIKMLWTNHPIKMLWTNHSIKMLWTNHPIKMLWTNHPIKMLWTNHPIKMLWTNHRIKMLWTNHPIKMLWTNHPIKIIWPTKKVMKLMTKCEIYFLKNKISNKCPLILFNTSNLESKCP